MNKRSAESRVPSARGFTIIEALVVMGIIALLGSILLASVHHMKRRGDTTAELAAVVALKVSVDKFKQDYDFLPPLVVDAPSPIDAGGRIRIWNAQDLADKDSSLNNGPSAVGSNRYSAYALPIYLIGTLDSDYDGADGLGSTTPGRDGQFSKRGKKHEPLIDMASRKTRTGAMRLFIPNIASPVALNKVACRIWDRWSDGNPTSGLSQPIRYYRWLPAYWQSGANKGQIQFWNVPVAAGGNIDTTLPPDRSELKDAEYAIVSAGPNRLFGDEDPDVIRTTLGLEPSVSEATVRARAASDNIVEVGR